MNAGTAFVLVIVLVVVALAVRSVLKVRGHCDGCSGCSDASKTADSDACVCPSQACQKCAHSCNCSMR